MRRAPTTGRTLQRGHEPVPYGEAIARSPADSLGPDLLTLLRAADGPMSLDELRATGVPRPADAIYQLQLAGHRITRSSRGHELDEDPSRAPGRRA